VNPLFSGKVASVLPDHTSFSSAKASVLDLHAEEHVLVLLVLGGKGILVDHAFVIGHRAERIADSEWGGEGI
jgi:hypothetical protein